jgi:YD repeat-containing protein
LKIGTSDALANQISTTQNSITYRYTVKDGDNGSITLGAITLNDTTIKDATGNVANLALNNVGDTTGIIIDAIAPSVSLTTSSTDTTNTAFTVNISFSENVTGFSSNGLTVTNATISQFSGSGTSYSATILPTAQGAVTLCVLGGVASDLAGNLNIASTQISVTYDNVAPSKPTSLAASNVTQSSVTLAWVASTDNTGIAGYDIYCGSTKVGSTTDAALTYTVTGLWALTGYDFTVVARDLAGNSSIPSDVLSVATLAYEEQYVYDELGRLITVTYENGDSYGITYDNSGNILNIIKK